MQWKWWRDFRNDLKDCVVWRNVCIRKGKLMKGRDIKDVSGGDRFEELYLKAYNDVLGISCDGETKIIMPYVVKLLTT